MLLEYFQMLDRIVDIDIGERVIRSVCTLPKESTIFEGHFPSYPMMPGVLLIECMAQTTGWLLSAIGGFTHMPIMVGVKEGKFRIPVFPGDVLEFEGKLVHEGSGYAVGKSAGLRNSKVVCNAQLTYHMMPYPSLEFRQMHWEWAERLNIPIKEFVK